MPDIIKFGKQVLNKAGGKEWVNKKFLRTNINTKDKLTITI
jgi:hypothetical protein